MISKNSISAVLAACIFLSMNCVNAIENNVSVDGFINDQDTIGDDISLNDQLQNAINDIVSTFIEAGFDANMFVRMLAIYDDDEDLADSITLSNILSRFISVVTDNLNDSRLAGKVDFIREQLDIVNLHASVLEKFEDEDFADQISKFSRLANRIDDEESVALRKTLFRSGIITEFNRVLANDSIDPLYQFVDNSLIFISRLPVEERAKFADCKEALESIQYAFTVGIDEQYLDGVAELFAEEANSGNASIVQPEETENPDEKYGRYISEAFSSNLKEDCQASSKFKGRILKALNPVLADNTKRLIKKLDETEQRLKKELAWRNGNIGEYEVYFKDVRDLHAAFTQLSEEDKAGELNFADTMRKIRSTIRNCEITEDMISSVNEALEKNKEERIATLGITASNMTTLFFSCAKNILGHKFGKRLESQSNYEILSQYFNDIATEGVISGKLVNEQFVNDALAKIGIAIDSTQVEGMRKALLNGVDSANTTIGKAKQDVKKLGYKTKSIAGSIVKLFSKDKTEEQSANKPFRKRDIILNPKKFWTGVAAKIKEKHAANSANSDATTDKPFRKRDIILNPKRFWTGVLNKHKSKPEVVETPDETTKLLDNAPAAQEPQKIRKRDRFKAGAKKVGKAIAKPFVRLKERVTRKNS